ncbi:MAG: metallophosphoesterase [Leptospiraceae bacterium]|nr:metallophosphoesterase [Leptospiraceae bacterium]
MKIIYLTDIHDGLNGLKNIFLHTSADIYILSGDIIYKAFFSTDRIIDFCTCQEELDKLAKKEGNDRNPYDFATYVIRYPNKFSEETQFMCGQYRYLFNKASKTMKEKYVLIYQLVQKYAKSPCYFLPGNYDIDLQYTDLLDLDLHRKVIHFGGLKFAGYGGAPIVTSGIPEKLAVKFHEYNKSGKFYSEPEDFFRDEEPDIVLIHNPAYGYLDKIPRYGNIGSLGIRRYLDDHNPSLVLSGHVHEDLGILKKNNTVFFNPSNFGPVESIFGFQEGGFYGEIYLEEKKVVNVNLMRIQGNIVTDLIRTNTSEEQITCEFENPNSPVSFESFLRQ